jgi:UDP-N-acetylglucosamine--N-acetylmuramyl-(pentapeptide) pyrophosphoryl-undecaprenol N-acetylglucosamine transferase
MDTLNVNRNASKDSFLWVGSKEGMDAELVKASQVPFKGISAAGIHGVGLDSLPGNLSKLVKGYFQSRQILDGFNPDVLLFTGGYVAVPMAAAGVKYPSLLYVPDIEPGMALKALSKLADRIDITADESRNYFRNQNKLNVTGYPTRSNLRSWTKAEAIDALGLKPELLTLLVLGGSKGARSINRAIIRLLPVLLEDIQVVHISGQLDWLEVESAGKNLKGISKYADRYFPHEYLHDEMGAALTAADIVISRAGASVLGEYPLFGLPAILIPYPHAWQYQEVNARYLSSRGAAVFIREDDIPDKLLPQVRELMANQKLRKNMSQAMRALNTPDAAASIASHLREMAAVSRGRK